MSDSGSNKYTCLTCGIKFNRLIYSTRHYTECRSCEENRTEYENKIYTIKIKPNIMKIYQNYKKKEEPIFLRKRRVLGNLDFNLLFNYLKNNMNAGIWAECMFGIHNHSKYPLKGVGVMLTSNQVNKLVYLYEEYLAKNDIEESFGFAIGPHILLTKELENKDRSLFSYHPGNTLKNIKKTWGNIRWMYNVKKTNLILGICNLCKKGVSGMGKCCFCFCRGCLESLKNNEKKINNTGIFHLSCKINQMLKGNMTCKCGIIHKEPSDCLGQL